jgi:hypothetical protein
VALTRLLKTPYSCRWCGWVSQVGETRATRKAQLAEHEAMCERQGKPWPFICNLTTYYNRWCKNEFFQHVLACVWNDMMVSAVSALQGSTLAAARELRRQVQQGEKDGDRRLAAVAILDRAGVETAAKATQAQQGMVAYVDVTEGELAAIADALRREAEGGGEI